MTRDETRAVILIMEAYLDGYEIQHRMKKCDSRSGLKPDWCDTDAPWWDFDSYEYRIKRTAKLRPWTADEVPLGMQARNREYPKTRWLIDRTSSEENRKDWCEKYEHSIDGGKTWLPCGVMEESK